MIILRCVVQKLCEAKNCLPPGLPIANLRSEIGNRVIVIVFSITITITITLIVCNCNSVRFFECVIVIVLAFCYYRLLLPLTFSLYFRSLGRDEKIRFSLKIFYRLSFTKIYR